jgi:long-chain fatty acid transport protein
MGRPRTLHANIDLPMVISLGTSYTGLEDWLFAVDTRFFDYKNTDGFGDRAVYDATGRLGGLDFSSIFAVAFGAQRKISDLLTVRAGYSFNQSPTRNSEAFFNIASPLYYQHTINTGATLTLTENMLLSLSYSYYFPSSRTGPIVLPTGTIPGSSFTNDLDVHVLSFGFTMKI